MKTFKCIVLLNAFIFVMGNVQAQQNAFKNSVRLHLGGFSIKERYEGLNFGKLIGASYERDVYRGIGAGIGYSQWGMIKLWPTDFTVFEPLSPYDTAYGTLEMRKDFKMVDAYIYYKQRVFKGHFLKPALGLSYTWGVNVRTEVKDVSYIIWYNGPWRSYEERAHYWGVVPQISYDYVFLKSRLNVGLDLRGRFYSGISPAQYDYGIHAGVNF